MLSGCVWVIELISQKPMMCEGSRVKNVFNRLFEGGERILLAHAHIAIPGEAP
jgi:hypothetical protein